eukprot:13168108-Alexandrium_andersonii.AAC.1
MPKASKSHACAGIANGFPLLRTCRPCASRTPPFPPTVDEDADGGKAAARTAPTTHQHCCCRWQRCCCGARRL